MKSALPLAVRERVWAARRRSMAAPRSPTAARASAWARRARSCRPSASLACARSSQAAASSRCSETQVCKASRTSRSVPSSLRSPRARACEVEARVAWLRSSSGARSLGRVALAPPSPAVGVRPPSAGAEGSWGSAVMAVAAVWASPRDRASSALSMRLTRWLRTAFSDAAEVSPGGGMWAPAASAFRARARSSASAAAVRWSPNRAAASAPA